MGEGSGACSLLLLHHRSLLPPLHPQPLGLSGAGSSGRRCSRAAQQGGSSQGAPGDPTAQSRDKNYGMQIKTYLLIPKEFHLGFCLSHLSPPISSLPQANSPLQDAQRFAGLSPGNFIPIPSLLSVPCSSLAPVTHRSRPQGTLTSASLALKPNKKLFIDTQV